MNQRLPDLLIIGAARCGTSSMHRNLLQHPDLEGPSCSKIKGNNKEVHFFDRHEKYSKGLKWYADCFEPEKPDSLLMESTPNYLYRPEVPARVKAAMPDAKFIIMLRNPIDRAWSHYYRWKMYKHYINWNIDVLLNPEHEIVRKGIYIEQLKRWFGMFPANSL